MTWGWNPDTVAALATAAATLFAAVAALIAVLDVRRRRVQDRRAQADLVAAWTTLEGRAAEGDASGMQVFDVVVWVANRSQLPVVNVVVTTMPPVTLGDIEPTGMRLHSLGPGQVERSVLGQTDGHDALGYPGRVLSIEFTDLAGQRWTRDQNNGLRAITS